MKTTLTSLAIILFSCTIQSQIVNIPDIVFKAYLVGESSINTNGDSEIDAIEAAAFNGVIDVDNKGIVDLTGIEAFKALTYLNCVGNKFTSLDISKNTALVWLDCHKNSLGSIDVSKNTALKYLYCYDNKLTSLDVSNNAVLLELDCNSNSLTSLDVRNGNNLNMHGIDFSNNPALNCIQVDNETWAKTNWSSVLIKDAHALYSNDCKTLGISVLT